MVDVCCLLVAVLLSVICFRLCVICYVGVGCWMCVWLLLLCVLVYVVVSCSVLGGQLFSC